MEHVELIGIINKPLLLHVVYIIVLVMHGHTNIKFLNAILPSSQGNERDLILMTGGSFEASANWHPKHCITPQDTTKSLISCPRKPLVTDPQIPQTQSRHHIIYL